MKVFVQVSGPPKSGKTELLKEFRKIAHAWAIKRNLRDVSFTFNENSVRNEQFTQVGVEVPDPTPTQEASN